MQNSSSVFDSSVKEHFMLEAVALAEYGKGLTAPNPCVGALITRKGHILARGWHKAHGQLHAEAEALLRAREKGMDLDDAELWVTLEPCNHQGLTPPCTEAIIRSGIKKVFVGIRDPNPSVRGGGIEYLLSRGLEVEVGIAEEACKDLIADFVLWQKQNRPYTYLKLASTLDGKIAARSGLPSQISGLEARKRVHWMRSRVQGVLVGGNTFYADNPSLTSRLTEDTYSRQPLAIVVTSRLPGQGSKLRLLQERPSQVIFWTSQKEASGNRADALEKKGVRIWPLPLQESGLDLAFGMQRLQEELDFYYLLCEGGGRLAMSMVNQEIVDELHMVFNPRIVGDSQAINVFSGREIESMEQAYHWRICSSQMEGGDLWVILRPYNRLI